MILILGGYFPKDKYGEIIENSKVQVQFSANIFQEKLFNGLKMNCNEEIILLSAPFVNSFPNGYKKIKFKELTSQDNIKYVGFNNLFGYRNISRSFNLKNKAREILDNYKEEKIDTIMFLLHYYYQIYLVIWIYLIRRE